MIDKGLIQKLHDEQIINKDNVFWWQLGFEGRSVLTEEKFRKGLRDIRYTAETFSRKEGEISFDVDMKIWVKDNVPILIKDVELFGTKMPCFITCCPMSHERGWRNLNSAIEYQLSPSEGGGLVYHQPHIRGVAAEVTKDFLFWYPFYFGRKPQFYSNFARCFDNLDIWLIQDPVHPANFYTNLIQREWKGKRAQKKPLAFPYSQIGLELKQVPYFEFDSTQSNITIYPLPIFEDPAEAMANDLARKAVKREPSLLMERALEFARFDLSLRRNKPRKRLDLPIILMSIGNGKVNMLGAGYLSPSTAHYWKLDPRQYSLAKAALKERTGLEAAEYRN